MHQAICVLDGATHNAIEFAALPEEARLALRSQFQCPSCHGPAHFRKASSSGHGPCFVGHPHADDCELFTGGEDPWGEGGDEVITRMEADQTRIVLAIGVDADSVHPVQGHDQDGVGGRRFTGGGQPVGTRIQRGPKRLLEWLVHSNSFRTSNMPIVLPNGEEIPVARFFLPFAVARGSLHAGLYRGFWGMPSNLRVWQRGGLTYLNTLPGRDGDTLSVYIPDQFHQPICERFRLDRLSDLTRKQTLFIGEAHVSGGGKFTFDVSSLRSLAVIEPR